MRSLLIALVFFAATTSNAQESKLRELMPPPKTAYLTGADSAKLYLANDVKLLAPINGVAPEFARVITKATESLRRAMKAQAMIATPPSSQDHSSYQPGVQSIVIGVQGISAWFDTLIARSLTQGERLEKHESYLLHITPTLVLIAGKDTSGLMHGVSRFEEMWLGSNEYLAAHILDYPDFPNRWVFSQHNLRGANAMNVLRGITDTMRRYHYNGLQQNDFKYNIIEQQPSWYFTNADTIRRYTDERQIEIIPGVAPIGYSDGILWHDPNLAEGMPAKATYIIEGDTGRLIQDPVITIPNGGFENLNGTSFSGFGFYDNDNNATQPDAQVVRSGSKSARTIDPKRANGSGNARFSLPVVTKPNKYYYLSAWVRTENIDRGEIRLLAIGTDDSKSLSLTHTAFNVASTTDRNTNNGWVKLGVLFNSQQFSKMNLYCGIWGGNNGTIWWDDLNITEAGFINVLRRDGTPLTVTQRSAGGSSFVEGRDFLPLHDQVMEQQLGLYDHHAAPRFRTKQGGQLKNGDTIDVSYYHAFTVHNDVSGYGQVMACPSDPKVDSLIKDQITRVKALHNGPHKFMMGHDEIRHMNWDHACVSRSMTPAQILGDNVTRVRAMIDDISFGSEVFMWSDMFDSLHNAHDDYYAVNGDLTGSWNYIPKDIKIVNWNSSNMAASLAFFARHGFKQMPSPYYDAKNTTNMRQWRLATEGVAGVQGMMYTTWASDYTFLRPFSYYNWGAGPYIIHKPIDSASLKSGVTVQATVLPDPFDPNDLITKVQAIQTLTGGSEVTVDLTKGANGFYNYTPNASLTAYKIVATNQQGLVRETPTYTLTSGTASVSSSGIEIELSMYPNPTTAMLTARSGMITRVLSLSGAEIMLVDAGSASVDVSSLAAGAYLAEIALNGITRTVKFVKE